MSNRDEQTGVRICLQDRSPAVLADPIVQTIAFIAALSVAFLALPAIDLWFTGLFFDPAVGFPMERLAALMALRTLGRWLIIAVVLTLIGAILIKLVRPSLPTPIRPCDVVFLLSSLLVGPGLVVKAFFKEFWGRPRPVQIDVFGGDAPFIGIWQISDHCLSDCSFVSAESSAAIWFVAVAMVVPVRWRRIAMIAALVLAAALSFNRIAFGRHFLSDVLLAWGLTLLVIAVMHRIVVERPPKWLGNDRLEAGLTRIGQWLRSFRTR